MKTLRHVLVALSFFVLFNAQAAVAPGPFSTQNAEYKFPAQVYPEIRSDMETELWAKVFWPANSPSSTKLPILFFLHGNHATCGEGEKPRSDSSCEYSESGTCPSGYVITPNHEGYNYVAENLASYGFIVVSINANRGITCTSGEGGDWGANIARGRLILKHMEQWALWNANGGMPASLTADPNLFKGRVSFNHVGIMGHSRGGEGARAAITEYHDAGSAWPAKIPGLNIEAIYEIGAVDGQTDRVLDAKGAIWNQLLPACDGDVSDLEGANPFDRMIKDLSEPATAQKSLTLIYGANHNFFNTEWQTSDSYEGACFNHKEIWTETPWIENKQAAVNLELMSRFFRAHVGESKDKALSEIFDPMFPLPSDVTSITRVDRDFVLSPNEQVSYRIDEFTQEKGKTSRMNEERVLGALMVQNVGEQSQVEWAQASNGNAFEIDAHSGPMDFTAFDTVEFRASLGEGVILTSGEADFSISLVDSFGKESNRVKLSDFAELDTNGTDARKLFQAVRIPLSAFSGFDAKMGKTVRFTFDRVASGKVFLSNLWLVKARSSIPATLASYSTETLPMTQSSVKRILQERGPRTKITRIKPSRSKTKWVREEHTEAGPSRSGFRFRVSSEVPFLPKDSLLTLVVGDKHFVASRFEDYKTLKTVSFFVSDKDYRAIQRLNDRTAHVVYNSMTTTSQIWDVQF